MAQTPIDDERQRLRRHFEIESELADRLRRATKIERKTLYKEVYGELFRRVELPGNVDAQKAQVGLLLQLVEPFLTQSTAFLEIGAGSCDLSLALAARLQRVWAVDAIDPIVDPKRAPESFSFVSDDDFAGVVPAGSVDLALSCHFVEHLHPDDLRDHLAAVHGKLVVGGVYVVVTPNRLYGPHDISKHFSDVPVGFHLREYTHFELAAEFEAAGFESVRVIGRIGAAPTAGTRRMVAAAERMLGAVPVSVRRAILRHAPRQEPFRPLEQVKVIGLKAADC
jgi:SAM-dependent methyltransferase